MPRSSLLNALMRIAADAEPPGDRHGWGPKIERLAALAGPFLWLAWRVRPDCRLCCSGGSSGSSARVWRGLPLRKCPMRD